MNKSKAAVTISKTIGFVQMLGGIAILFVFGICTIMCLCDEEYLADAGVSFLIVCLILDAVGIWLIVMSKRRTKLIDEFKSYVEVVSNVPDGYIPDISASLGTSEDVVKQKLSLMIEKKFFANAFIDQNSNCFVIANRQNSASGTASQPQARTNARTTEMVTLKCKSCGGINKIPKGAVVECDYCGSPIKGE